MTGDSDDSPPAAVELAEEHGDALEEMAEEDGDIGLIARAILEEAERREREE